MKKTTLFKRMMAAVLALAIFFCDSFVAEAAGNISLATASVKTYGNDDDVWSFPKG